MAFKPLLCCLAVLSGSMSAFAVDPATFRGGASHTGAYDGSGTVSSSRIKWKFHTGGFVISSPAVTKETIFVGSADGNLYAVALDSGKQKWKFDTKSRVVSSPSVTNDTVYFGAYDGNFYAVEAATGKLRWKFKTGGEHRFTATHLHGSQPVAEAMPDPFDVFLSSPVVWDGAVFFGSGDGNVYSLNAASGILNWKFKTGDVVHASPAIADGMLFVGSWDSYFYALDATSGKEKWRFKTGEDADTHNQVGIQSSAAVADGIVYFGCRDSNLYAVDAATGQRKWSFANNGSWVVGSPATRDGKVYFATSDSATFHALDAKTGASLFTVKFPGWPFFSSPALAGNMIYIGSNSGRLFTIDLTTQKPSWTFETDASKQNGPAYTKPDGGPRYEAAFASDFYDDMLIGFGKMMSVGPIMSSPVLVDGVIYFGSNDGNLYALQ